MPLSVRYAQGFTLVEIMVVIVILTIFAGMMTLSVGGSDSQRNRAFYEHLQSNLGYIRLLSAEKMQPYGLAIKPNSGDNRPGELVVVRLANSNDKSPSWQLDDAVEPLVVPANILLDIQPLTSVTTANFSANSSPLKSAFDPNQAPPIIWFGNGDATPVQITIKKVNPSGDNKGSLTNTTFEVGNPIRVNASGAVEVAP